MLRIWHAFVYSVNGLRYALRNEQSFQQEFTLFLIFGILILFLPVSLALKCLLFIVNTFVIVVELINSAIEAIVDIASPEFHELAKQAKDLGSAAVFISIFLAVTVWIAVLVKFIGVRS